MNNEHGVFVTLGASNHTVNPRAEYDYYATDSSAIAYAWFIWEKGFRGTPILKWFN